MSGLCFTAALGKLRNFATGQEDAAHAIRREAWEDGRSVVLEVPPGRELPKQLNVSQWREFLRVRYADGTTQPHDEAVSLAQLQADVVAWDWQVVT